MEATLERMAKSESLRVPSEITRDIKVIAPALGETVPTYVARVLKEAVKRDHPKAMKKIAERNAKILEE